MHTENKPSLPADGDFRVPVRLSGHKQLADVSLYVSVEPRRDDKKPRHTPNQAPGVEVETIKSVWTLNAQRRRRFGDESAVRTARELAEFVSGVFTQLGEAD